MSLTSVIWRRVDLSQHRKGWGVSYLRCFPGSQGSGKLSPAGVKKPSLHLSPSAMFFLKWLVLLFVWNQASAYAQKCFGPNFQTIFLLLECPGLGVLYASKFQYGYDPSIIFSLAKLSLSRDNPLSSVH